jgi:hypothetical protein
LTVESTIAKKDSQRSGVQEAHAFSIPNLTFNANSPEPIRIPRSKLDQQFAVLLMRSVYDAVDELDFISMSEFQAKFWKLRQNLYEPYLLQYRPLRIRQVSLSGAFDFCAVWPAYFQSMHLLYYLRNRPVSITGIPAVPM